MFLDCFKKVLRLFICIKQSIVFFTFPYRVCCMFKYCNRARKNIFFASFFRNFSKMAETILIKKNWAKPWHFGLQKSSNK